MSAPQQTLSGKGFLEPSLSVVSRVEKEQFEDGSLDQIVSEFAHICHVEPPDLDLTCWLDRGRIGK